MNPVVFEDDFWSRVRFRPAYTLFGLNLAREGVLRFDAVACDARKPCP